MNLIFFVFKKISKYEKRKIIFRKMKKIPLYTIPTTYIYIRKRRSFLPQLDPFSPNKFNVYFVFASFFSCYFTFYILKMFLFPPFHRARARDSCFLSNFVFSLSFSKVSSDTIGILNGARILNEIFRVF